MSFKSALALGVIWLALSIVALAVCSSTAVHEAIWEAVSGIRP